MSTGTNQSSVTYEYQYDRNGNLIEEYTNGTLIPTKTYSYNTLNQLIGFQDKEKNITSSYTYYPHGLRKTKTVSGSTNSQINGTVLFHYNGDNVIMEEKGNGFLSRYTIGLSYIRRIDSLNNKYYYLYDSHGDVTVITDANGNIVKSYDYDIYGKEQEEESDGQVFYNPIRYSGQFFDEESGLYYLRARYYSPEIMRFVSEETYKGDIINPLTLNYYMYCWGNPVMLFDSSGNIPLSSDNDYRRHRKSKPPAFSRSNPEFMREIREIQREKFERAVYIIDEVIIIEGGASAGIGGRVKFLGSEIGGSFHMTYDAVYENSEWRFYNNVDAAGGLNPYKKGLGEWLALGVSYQARRDYNDPEYFGTFDEICTKENDSWFWGLDILDGKIKIGDSSESEGADIKFTIIGGEISVGPSVKGEISINISKLLKFWYGE